MRVNAARLGAGITTQGDPRIMRAGRFLRDYKIDELAQLLNVIKGDMSLVGPRPEDPRYVALYTPVQRQVLSVKPGMTSLASLQFRHEESLLQGQTWETHYVSVVMPQKLALELDYLQRRSLVQDGWVIIQTVLSLLCPGIFSMG